VSLTTEQIAREQSRVVEAYARREEFVASGRYGCFDTANILAIQECEQHFLAALYRHRRTSLADYKFLEVGCGTGFWLRQFLQWGARPENVFGLDVVPARVEKARSLSPPGVTVRGASAAKMTFLNESFDIVLQATVFSSILDPEIRTAVAAEMLRVLRPGGLIASYDFHLRNPRNADVCGIGKAELRRLFPACSIDFEHITLLPPLARLLAPRSALLVHAFSAIKFLCTHYLAVIEKR
jgi:SAM-dependent methyltransferase